MLKTLVITMILLGVVRVGCLSRGAARSSKASRLLSSASFSSATAASTASTPKTLVAYFTDVEGDRDYLERYISLSKVLHRDGKELVLKDGAHLVFGGDVVDRGGYDLDVLRTINGLKEKFPDNVHLILGNRDANKMR